MSAGYRAVLATPGALSFTLAGLLARLGGAMGGVATVVLIADRRGSYALAGAVSAAGVITAAALLPLLGRLVDRYGQARTAVPTTLASIPPAAALLLCTHYGAPDWTLPLCAAASSTVPNLGGMARARWAHLLRADEAARHRANALEQALDELCYLAGPVLAGLLCTLVLPEAGLVAARLLCLLGVGLLATQHATEPPLTAPLPRPAGGVPLHRRADGVPLPRRAGGVLRIGGLRVMTLTFLATGVVFGSLEVTTIAYTDSLGRQSLAGPLLALVAAGSCASGLAFGLLRPRRTAAARLLGGVAAMALLLLLPLAAALSGAGLTLLAAALLTAGSGTAPTMVSGMTLVQQLLPTRRLNEGMGVAVSGILIGISAGSTLAGTVVQHTSPAIGYLVPAGAALLALLIATAGYPRLTPAPS